MEHHEDYYCPICLDKLERLSGCGAVGYLCHSCKRLISRKEMLCAEQRAEQLKEKQESQENQPK